MGSTKASRGLLNDLRAHPILCLLLLTPGIPEYLTSSSPLNAIILNPPKFILQLAINLGLYGSGVLLIREATVRWNKGWATILLLGAAYGILEEGLALSTLYNPAANPVHRLGVYGHFWGINWVWTAGIVPVHMIFSVSLPILLLGLALPETNGKRLVKSKGALMAIFAFLGIDVSGLFSLVTFGEHFWMGWPVFASSIAAIILLIIAARFAPPRLLHANSGDPRVSPFRLGIIGALFYAVVLFGEQLGIGRIPAWVDFSLVIVVQALFLIYIQKVVGNKNNSRQLITLTAGLVVPISAIGFISEIPLPLVLVADLMFALFIWKLLKKCKQ